MTDIELKRKLQLLKGADGNYVLSTITDLYALIDFINQLIQEREKQYFESVLRNRSKSDPDITIKEWYDRHSIKQNLGIPESKEQP